MSGWLPERPGQVAGDLGHLEAVGEPVADEVVHLRPVHLGLGGQPPRRGRVHDAGPVALVRRPLGRLDPLGRLLDEPLAVVLVVQLGAVHQHRTLGQCGSDRPRRARGRSGSRSPNHATTCDRQPSPERRRPDVLAPDHVEEVQLGGVRAEELGDRGAEPDVAGHDVDARPLACSPWLLQPPYDVISGNALQTDR